MAKFLQFEGKNNIHVFILKKKNKEYLLGKKNFYNTHLIKYSPSLSILQLPTIFTHFDETIFKVGTLNIHFFQISSSFNYLNNNSR